MSPMLALAILALVIVVGLTLLQRRAHADTPRGRAPASPPVPGGPTPGAAPGRPIELRADPVLGAMAFDDGIWLREDDLDFAGTTALLEITGTPDGPTAADREYVNAALAQQRDLDARARALILPELERRGVDAGDLEVYELAVGPDDDGVLSAYLWYNVGDFPGEIGVKSSDQWRTLSLEVVE